jgi:phage shock protein A
MTEVEKWQGMARQGLVLADQARVAGDEQKALEYEKAAQSAATQLVTSEQAVEDLKTLHDQALNAAQQARKAVENNKMLLEEKLAQRTKLLSQLEQARMQETVASSLESMSALAAPGNTPSLDEVRDKIEQRYATAMGRAELASDTVEGRMIEVQRTTLDMAGQSRLSQIRASMASEQLAAGAERPAVTDGGSAGSDQDTGRDATVSRLDEIRASLAKDSHNAGADGAGTSGKNSGDPAAAG